MSSGVLSISSELCYAFPFSMVSPFLDYCCVHCKTKSRYLCTMYISLRVVVPGIDTKT